MRAEVVVLLCAMLIVAMTQIRGIMADWSAAAGQHITCECSRPEAAQ
jgi:hypothetical protein